jgi:hypothetical protein
MIGHAVVDGVALAALDVPALAGPLLRHPVSLGILGLSFLVAGAFLLHRTIGAAPRPSLTMGVA